MKRASLLMVSALFLLTSCGGGSSSSAVESSSEQSSQATSAETSKSTSEATSESQKDTTFHPEEVSNSLIVHYHRDDGDYATWFLWLWPDGGEGDSYYFEYGDTYGGVCVASLDLFKTANIGVIVRDGSWNKDPDGDRFIDTTILEKDGKGNYEVWLYTGVSLIYDEEPKNIAYLSTCAFVSMSTISVATGAGELYGLELLENGVSIGKVELEGVSSYRWKLGFDAKVDAGYKMKATFVNEYTIESGVSMGGIFTDPDFDTAYKYDGELGAIYTSEKTTFRVWSPASSAITLRLYDTGTPASLATDAHPGSDTPTKTVEMAKGEKGVFEAEVEGDLDGTYYTYFVTNYAYPKGKEVIDPYARAAGVNGLRGEVLDLDKTDPDGFRDFELPVYDRLASVVYETHIADLTSSKTWGGTAEKAKKYAGFFEEGTTYEGVKTGFDHIKELGVSAVQILPMFDQANDEVNVEFNWGYNPLNYNVPEGCYSSDPYDGAVRIHELKQLIQAYGEADISIIMDVVYNHVNSVSGLSFDVLMPYYYFRYNGDALYNGSGCGNETASERSMFRKFMIDSATYWTEEYRLGGFRFDLMGLHDLTTMSALTSAVKEINPGAIIYGEPWTGGTSGLTAATACTQANMAKFSGYGCFNDKIRDGLIAGGLAAATDKAWATVVPEGADEALLKKLTAASKSGGASLTTAIMGAQSRSKDPSITTSYVTCHDNYTLYDRAQAAYGKTLTDAQCLAINRLAQSAVMLSQGTAFMLAGEEMLRTKGGNSNSYNASYEVNELDYSRKVSYASLFETYKILISLKRTLPGLHLDLEGVQALGSGHVAHNADYSCLTYEIAGEGSDVYRVALTNGIYSSENQIDIDFGAGTVVLDSENNSTFTSSSSLKPNQIVVVRK